jgi:large conductance mechanosensitive channel
MSLIKEFKEFAMKGNVVDMAVGIVIGAAFTGIVTSLVNDVMMPPLGLVAGADFSNLAMTLKDGAEPVQIRYGLFINTLVNFLIVALAMFMVIKAMNVVRHQKQEAAVPPPPTKQEVLLTEIRDLLKQRA